MTTWHWVRHGPTHEKSFVGWRDVPADLTDTEQLARLSAHLPDIAIIVASDLIRASATADAIAHPMRKRLPDDPRLREFNFGVWDGMHFNDVAARDPELSRAYWENPGTVAPPSGESWNNAAARVAGTVTQLNTAFPASHIIAVAHFGVILTQVQQALGVTPHQALGHSIDNLSVTTLHYDAGTWSCKEINHLE